MIHLLTSSVIGVPLHSSYCSMIVAKREPYITESMVFLQFLLESGDLMRFIMIMLRNPMLIADMYQPDSIVLDKRHHVDLLSVISLLHQVRFDLGYIPEQHKPQSVQLASSQPKDSESSSEATQSSMTHHSSKDEHTENNEQNTNPRDLIVLKKLSKVSDNTPALDVLYSYAVLYLTLCCFVGNLEILPCQG